MPKEVFELYHISFATTETVSSQLVFPSIKGICEGIILKYIK